MRRIAVVLALFHAPMFDGIAAAATHDGRWSLSGGLTVIGLVADARGNNEEVTASGDLFITRPWREGEWLFYVEGNTSLEEDGPSTVFPEVNADAGTALDRDRGGRVQISEANYRLRVSESGAVTLGLIDPSAYLDRTRITNDENLLFIGVSFVNNPTIEFPDYTLGAAFEGRLGASGPRLNAVLASSNGLADNPNVSYSQLVQVGDSGKGVFSGAGLGWVSDMQLVRLGGWVNTRAHEAIDGASGGHANYGAYAVYGRAAGSHALSARVGAARDEVSLASRFVALAYRFRWSDHALGAGVAHTFASSEAQRRRLGDTTQAEVFARIALDGERVHLTASVQYLRHSSFVAVGGDPREEVVIGTLRFRLGF